MKRLCALCLALLCCGGLLCGCGRDMNWVISNEPCVRGIVEEIGEEDVLIRVSEADELEDAVGGLVRTAKATRLRDGGFHAQVGDEVAVYYDSRSAVAPGTVPVIREIHGYCLITPAERPAA